METAKIRVVTIVATAELQERLERDLLALGVSGLTIGKVDGRGSHGVRRAGLFDRANVRIETLVSRPIADKILQLVVTHYAGQECLAYVHDVEAVPKEHFG
jgi:nitrogen regulatory protein PII